MPTKNENIIERFLLGEMSESERAEFEERFIMNADLFDEIAAFEDDLIEKYVRGWMNAAEKSKFESAFLTTEKRRERVEFSRQFIEKIKDEAATLKKNEAESSANSFWQNLSELFLTPKTAFAAALSLLLVAFGSWFIYQNLSTQNVEIAKDDNSNAAATPTPLNKITPPNLNRNSNEDISENSNLNTNETNSQNVETPTPQKTPQKIEETPTPEKTPVQRDAPNPVFALFPGTVRSEGKNNVLNLPKNAKGATFQLNLETVDYQTFRADLNSAEANVIFQNGDLKARNAKINLFIPADVLKKGDYILKLYGKNKNGDFESVADFQFRVND